VNGLPHGWVEVTLQDVAIWSSGGTPSRSNPAYYEGEIPWFKTGELGPRVLYSAEEHISQAAVDASSAKLFPKGSVALAMYGATIGKTSIFGIEAATNQACAVGKPDAVSVEFLYYFLVSQEKSFGEAGKGGAQPNISQGIVKSWPFLLPPSAEQTRILEKLEELLTDLDAGVAELKAAQKKLAQYHQSLLKAAVEGALTAEWRANNSPTETGAQLLERILQERRARWEAKQLAKFKEPGKAPPKDWQKKYPEPVQPDATDLPELPQGWVWASVDCLLADIETGKSFKCDERPPAHDEIGVVKVSAVSWGEYDEQESKTCTDESRVNIDLLVKTGDFLFSRANTVELVGACVIAKSVNLKVMLSDKILRLVFVDDEIKPWLLYLLRSKLGRKQIEFLATGNQESMKNIGQERIRSIAIPIAPKNEMSEAMALVEQASGSANQQTLANDRLLKHSTAQRQNILKAAFSGQLVSQDPSDEPASELLERIRAERAAHQAVKKQRGRKAKEAA
jgi:type I restriction enzyme, S subunit